MKMVEIAKIAGVSHSTVSRVIHGNPHVSSATAERVRKAMKEVGYVPRPKRRSSDFQSIEGLRTGNIAVLTMGMDMSVIHTPMINDTIKGIERALSALGLHMILAGVDEVPKLPVVLSSGKTDGFILIGWKIPPQGILEAVARFPCLWISSPSPKFDSVQPDNYAVGRLAAHYLIERGLLDLAILDSCPYHPEFQARRRAFAFAAKEAAATVEVLVDVEEKPPSIANLDRHESTIMSLVDRFVKLSPRPKGLFIPSDLQTAVAYRMLQQWGIKMGVDVTIVSCDDWQAVLTGLNPRPATINIHPEVVGELAVSHLLWCVNNKSVRPRITLSVAPSLVKTEETGNFVGNPTTKNPD